MGEQRAWYPSTISQGCARKAILNRAGVEGNPLDAVTLRKFWMGEAIHSSFQSFIESSFSDEYGVEVVGNEVEVRDEEFGVAGRIDTLAKVEDGLEVWEYKSAASRSFSYGDFPRDDHILQVGIYLTFRATCQGTTHGVSQGTLMDEARSVDPECRCDGSGKLPLPKRARIIYFSKDDARLLEYVVEPTNELTARVKSTLASLNEAYEQYKADGTLPEPLPLVIKKGRKPSMAAVARAIASGGELPEQEADSLEEDWRVRYCEYRGTGRCCGDNRGTDTERNGSATG